MSAATALTPAQRYGAEPVVSVAAGDQPLPDRIERSFGDRIRSLPDRTRLLLLIAAADDTGELATVLRAGRRLGASLADLEPAEEARLIRTGRDGLSFTHPLIRTAAYHTGPLAQRLAAHRAIADGLDSRDVSGRRAWHWAAATSEPDESVAAALERTAENARARGGYAAVAAAYRRAAQLTPDPPVRVQRLALAATAAAYAGSAPLAAELIDRALPLATDPLMVARLKRVRVAVDYEQDHLAGAVEPAVAAALVADRAADEAAFMFLSALNTAWARNGHPGVARVVARMPESASARIVGRITRAVHLLHSGKAATGAVLLRELLHEIGGARDRLLWQRACVQWWFHWLGDLEAALEEATDLAEECRRQGAIGMLPRALLWLTRAQLSLPARGDPRLRPGLPRRGRGAVRAA